MLSEVDIVNKYKKFIDIIKTEFNGDRLTKIMDMVTYFEDRITTAPASSKEFYHSSFVGGYLHHILQVYDIAMNIYMNIYYAYSQHPTFTREELVFSVLFHDLGKLGDTENEYYIFQTNKWRKDNLKENYTINPAIVNMEVPDRSLYILQHFGIDISQNEWIAIKIHDGMYSETNAKYFAASHEDHVLKSMLPYIVHTADLLSSRFEYEAWRYKSQNTKNTFNIDETEFTSKKKFTSSKKTITDVFTSETFDIDDVF